MSFYLSGRPEDSCRLKSFSSRSQGGKMKPKLLALPKPEDDR